MKVAIVGTGISGLVCAHLLHPHHDITVFEAAERIGGHTNTVHVDLPGESHEVDTGFIVFNDRNYPNFTKLLGHLGVASHDSDMSFSVSRPDGSLEWRGMSLNRLFSQRSNLLRPSFHRLLVDIMRFHRRARLLLEGPESEPGSLSDLVSGGRFSPRLVAHYLTPVGSSIWSADPARFVEQFPAMAFARFFHNHGLLGVRDRPRWRTVSGGAARYVEAICAPFQDRILTGTAVDKIRRLDSGGVELHSDQHGPTLYDQVVLATHSDQALRMLSDPSKAEEEILGAIRYQPNLATLHTDRSLLPKRPRAWASWNYHLMDDPAPLPTLTYHLNQLQGLSSREQICVSLNRDQDIDPALVHGRFEYDHPVFDAPALAAQGRRAEIQGVQGTFFAGAYWGYGFHEDGVNSALDVASHFGLSL